jgi:hypothetical protein
VGVSDHQSDQSERRQAKQSRQELRDLLIRAGRDILAEEGLHTGSSNLTFKRVFERVERTSGMRYTNASVIRRVWENQAEYQADVLMAVAHDESRPETEVTLQAAASALDGRDLSTPEGRAGALRELCRVGGNANARAIAESANWTLWINVVALGTTSANPELQERIRTDLAEGYETVSRFWESVYDGLGAVLGLRLRAPWTLQHFTNAASSYSQGCSIRQRVTGELELFSLPTGPDGEDQEWTLFGLGFEALVLQFFEWDPDHGTGEPPGASPA